MTTTAEGIETERQCACLREVGCREAQGYLFGRPMPWKEAQHLIAANDAVEARVA